MEGIQSHEEIKEMGTVRGTTQYKCFLETRESLRSKKRRALGGKNEWGLLMSGQS